MSLRRLLLAGVATLALPMMVSGITPTGSANSALTVLLGASEASAAESIGAEVGKPLKAAQELSNKGDFSGALAKAKEANAVSGKSAYETYVVNQFIAFSSIKLNNYAAAGQAYEAMLSSGKVPAKDRGQTIKTAAQIYFQAGNAAKAGQFVDLYQREIGTDTDLQALAAQGYYQKGDFKNASASAKSLVDKAHAGGGKPQEAVLQIWLASAYKLGDKGGQRQALTSLVENYPSATYWSDLLNATQADLGRSDRLGLEVFRLRAAVGALKTSDDYMEMAQLAIQNGLPGEAQSVMERGFSSNKLGGANKNREVRLLTMAKTQAAQDRASLPKTGSSAKANATLGEAYMTYGDKPKAIELYKAALAAKVENADEVKLHLGQAYLASGNKAEARKAFGSISKDPKYKAIASLWIAVSDRQSVAF